MKKRTEGILIAIQFFTAVPVKRSFELDEKRVLYAVQWLPFVGLLIGAVLSGLLWLVLTFTPFSMPAAAFIIWMAAILLTGGLHLDGWMDSSDAYFSYRDREKRLEIMKDPRTGAFGVLSVIILLAARFLFIYEVIEGLQWRDYFLMSAIPMLSRMGMGALLAAVPSVKSEGLAYFFQKDLKRNKVLRTYFTALLAAAAVFYMAEPLLSLYLAMLAALILGFTIAAKAFFKEEFGGVTGDLLGASAEGGETWLWMGLWLLHYFAMA
ncbi:adenosylcobinamide-GDP ribazoletransferase [Metabacillus sp. FJAT-52054]|uniref:Adenosylcobinamide-GDP ribazoletransferase n=1 Tax=Metabacillus sediminis TaxID=3117746 RepID=A0ABZ2NMN3_9BACI